MGTKHEIKQWIPGKRKVPIDISILAGSIGFDNKFDTSGLEFDGHQHEVIFNINNWTIQGIVSKKISVLTLYGAFGYSSITSNLKMNGTYIIKDEIDPALTFEVTDPVDITYGEHSFRVIGGLRLKFDPVTLHDDYTWQEYSIASAGVGFRFK